MGQIETPFFQGCKMFRNFLNFWLLVLKDKLGLAKMLQFLRNIFFIRNLARFTEPRAFKRPNAEMSNFYNCSLNSAIAAKNKLYQEAVEGIEIREVNILNISHYPQICSTKKR